VSIIVDASMTIAWLFRDERVGALQSVLRRVAREGGLVPSLWRLEIANVLRNAVRRGHCEEG
jgi:predicted nucleic acid-binding protein